MVALDRLRVPGALCLFSGMLPLLKPVAVVPLKRRDMGGALGDAPISNSRCVVGGRASRHRPHKICAGQTCGCGAAW